MYATLIAVAVLWGAAAGVLLPRAAYRLSVEPEEKWRDSCPAGHPIAGPARGWLGTAACAACEVPGPSAPPFSSALPGPSAPSAPSAPGVPSVRSGADRMPGEGRPNGTGSGEGWLRGGRPAAVPAGVPGTALRVPCARSLRVPAVTALGCAALAAAAGPRPELAVWLLLAPFAVLLALVDLRVHRLPDQLTLPLAGSAAVLLGPVALLPGEGGSWPAALLGGAVLGGCYLVLFLVNPNGMGFGDVKLSLSLGVVLGWYGWYVLFAGAFAGFLLGSLYGLALMLLRRAGRGSTIPFGPFMIIGALSGILLGAITTGS